MSHLAAAVRATFACTRPAQPLSSRRRAKHHTLSRVVRGVPATLRSADGAPTAICAHRLKSVLREYRKLVDQEPDNEQAVSNLTCLLGAMAANVSAVKERKHQAVVSDVLGIKLWPAPHVSAPMGPCTAPHRTRTHEARA